MNKVILVGNLGKDIEVKHTQSGTDVGNFSVATSRRFKKNDEWVEETDWHNIVFWRCGNVAQYLTKGTKVAIEGRLQTRSWEDQSGATRYKTEVVVDRLELIGGKPSGGQKAAPSDNDHGYAPSDDDIPF